MSYTVRWMPRVVLDSMYFRGANTDLVERLARLRDRGATIHLSLIVVAEALARADRDGSLGAVLGPLRRLCAVLDQDAPLLPCDMYRPPDPRRVLTLNRRARDELREARAIWRYLNSPAIQTEGVNSARVATMMLRDRASKYLELATPWPHGPARDVLTAVVKSQGEPAAIAFFAGYLLDGWKIGHPALRRRHDAHARVMALRMLRGARGSLPTENDDVDLRLLNHVADGQVLATGDTKLRRSVEEAGSFQLPWVRTLEELEEELPTGPPW